MNKAIKYRVYPTQEQKILFLKTFGCCRKVYNLMLADKIAHYQTDRKMLQNTPAQYQTAYPYLKEVDSFALSNTQQDLQHAFENFFNGLKKKRKVGFPKFKSKKKSKRSYTTNNQNGTVCIAGKNHIRLPKVGLVEAKIHRLPEPDWKLKAATVSQSSDGAFYISLLFFFEKEIQPVLLSDNAIGLDYKSDGLYMDSNGVVGSDHKYFRESQRKLAKAQRKLAKKKGSKKNETKSNNYWKQLNKVNKSHRHVANQRLDHLHKKSTEIEPISTTLFA